MVARLKTCEYVSVSGSLQQAIRDREVASDRAVVVTAALDEPCGKPADGVFVDRDGSERSYCATHRRQVNPDWALARHP